MHTFDKPQRITRRAQRPGHPVRRKLTGRCEYGHGSLLFSFQTAVPHVGRNTDDFEIPIVVHESDAPAHWILVSEVSPRQPFADHGNRRGVWSITLVN